MTLHAMFEAGDDFKVGFAGGPVTTGATTTRFIPSATLACRRKMRRVSGFFTCEICRSAQRQLPHCPRHWRRQRALRDTLAVINDLIEAGKYVEVLAFRGAATG